MRSDTTRTASSASLDVPGLPGRRAGHRNPGPAQQTIRQHAFAVRATLARTARIRHHLAVQPGRGVQLPGRWQRLAAMAVYPDRPGCGRADSPSVATDAKADPLLLLAHGEDRKSTRLNSSHYCT